jgi:hypothetical protein
MGIGIGVACAGGEHAVVCVLETHTTAWRCRTPPLDLGVVCSCGWTCTWLVRTTSSCLCCRGGIWGESFQ